MNVQCLPEAIEAAPLPRRKTVSVNVGGVIVGGGAPIVVQSMTNTDTADVESTSQQIAQLARAGSELVRITVDRDEAAAAVPHIRDRLAKMRVKVPLIGDFHYIGHKLLAQHPACAEALDGIASTWQCRLPREARPAVQLHHRDGDQLRKPAHRRELGSSTSPDQPDGRQRQGRKAARRVL
jgi:hypothetical protein